jgi:prepilin-type N-terminal cleavage/methylation domain-containing protein
MLNRKYEHGYTIIELLIVVLVIGVMAGFAFVGITDSQARARDTERTADIDTLNSRLEEYFTDNGGYPETVSTTIFPGLDPAVLNDPQDVSIDIRAAVDSQADASASADPDGTGADYAYIPYPTGCSGITCRGYILKSYIEIPTQEIPNPYVRGGLHNN